MGDPLDAPDSDRPELWFKDEGSIYEVAIYPSMMPIAMTQGRSTSLILDLVTHLVSSLIGRFIDPRWKVVVSSKPMSRATMFHAVHVEFVGSSDDAVAMQAAIVRRWEPGQFADATPMTSRELGRARRATRRGLPAPQPRTLAGHSLTRMHARFCLFAGVSLAAAGLAAVGMRSSSDLLAVGYLAAAFGLVVIAVGVVLFVVDRVTRSTPPP